MARNVHSLKTFLRRETVETTTQATCHKLVSPATGHTTQREGFYLKWSLYVKALVKSYAHIRH